MRDKGTIVSVMIVIFFIVMCVLYINEEDAAQETTQETSTTVQEEAPVVEEITMQSVQMSEPQEEYWNVSLDEELQTYIKVICRNSDIEPEYIIAICEKESRCDPAAVGDNGDSLGLMQIQPRFHQERMDKLNCPDLLNPYDNVTVGLDILEELYAYYDGKIEMVLMAYNGGYKYAESQQWVSQYALDVMNRARELKKSKNE